MSRSRDRRITLRFYLDDPEACELYDQLQAHRRETGTPMSTLAMELLKAYFDSRHHTDDTSNEPLRDMIRTEIRTALREWSLEMPVREAEAVAVTSESTDSENDEYDPDSIRAALAFTL